MRLDCKWSYLVLLVIVVLVLVLLVGMKKFSETKALCSFDLISAVGDLVVSRTTTATLTPSVALF